MVVFGPSGCIRNNGCIRARVFLLAMWLYSCKVVLFEQKLLSSFIVVVFGQKWLCSYKNCFIWAKLLYLGKMVVFGQKWLYSDKVVVFWQMWVFSGILLYSGKSDFLRSKIVVFWQSGCNRAEVVALEIKWLYSG